MQPKCPHKEGHYVIGTFWNCPICSENVPRAGQVLQATNEGPKWITLEEQDINCVITCTSNYPMTITLPQNTPFRDDYKTITIKNCGTVPTTITVANSFTICNLSGYESANFIFINGNWERA